MIDKSATKALALVIKERIASETDELRERVAEVSGKTADDAKRMKAEIAELRAENTNLSRELTQYVRRDAEDGVALRREIATLKAELQQLREHPGELLLQVWQGPYEDGRPYQRGMVVQRSGSAWIALRETMNVPPGSDRASWTMLIKRGKNGKDAYDPARERTARPTLTLRKSKEQSDAEA